MNSGRKADGFDCPWELLRISVVVIMLPLPFKAKRRAPGDVPEPSHKPELDGIRGIALLAVLLSHGCPYIDRTTALSKIFAYAMIPGWSGAETFFVPSGFLITGILLKSKKAENYFSSFYARRFLRIFPIYYFVLTVGLLAATHFPGGTRCCRRRERRASPMTFTRKTGRCLAASFVFEDEWVRAFLEPGGGRAVLYRMAAGDLAAAGKRDPYAVRGGVSGGAAVARADGAQVRIRLYRDGADHEPVDGLLVGVVLAILLRRGQIPRRWIYLCMGVGAAIIGFIAVFHHRELIETESLYADDWDHGIFIAVGRAAGVVAAADRLGGRHSGCAMAANRGEV